MNQEIDLLLSKIRAKAAEVACCDDEDFNAYDYSGGNYDDAFQSGISDGEIMFARELLRILK